MKTYELNSHSLEDAIANKDWPALKACLDLAEEAIDRGDEVMPTRYPYNAAPVHYPPAIQGQTEWAIFRKKWEGREKPSDEELLND